MLIRIATKKDARRISYLIRNNTEKVTENNYTQEQIKTWKKANTTKAVENNMKKRVIFCAFQNNKLIGTIGLQEKEVVGLYVNHAKRKLGIGRKLLQHLELYAQSIQLKELVLTSTRSAKRFYKNNGYKVIKSVIVKVNETEFKETEMKKILKQ